MVLKALVTDTKKLDDVLSYLGADKAVFYPGGHGPVFDLPNNKASQTIICTSYESGRPVSAVCHAIAVFVEIKLSDG
jgi:putative intracellular protease/amidase